MYPGNQSRSWKVLLIGGNSGAGKTTVVREVARHFDVPWLQVDDFRLMLQHNTDPESDPALHYFDGLSQVYRNPPELLTEWRIATAQRTSHAIEVVVANHASFGGPAILEGDDIVPALAAQSSFAGLRVEDREVRAIFLIEEDENLIASNMGERGRDFTTRPAEEQVNHVRMSLLYGQLLMREAERYGVPVLKPQPSETLTSRVLSALG
jgi:2-phosphoglycerate kinase